MSLSTRITLLLIIVLSVGLGGAGIFLSRTVRKAQRKEVDGRLNARLAWMESAMDVDYEERKVELEARGAPAGMAAYWSISTRDGRTLWSSAESPPKGEPLASLSREIIFGEEDWTDISGPYLQKGLDEDEEESDEEWRQERDFGRDHTVYRFEHRHSRLELVLQSSASTRNMQAELKSLNDTLLFGIPCGIIVLGSVLGLLVRWQLGPLRRMAGESGHIGPDSLDRRISEAGGSVECRQLRSSINAMIERLAEGISRERRFARAAAHDLRTPLAQLRIQAEVALRHPRPEAEYRRAISEMIEDIGRLEKMITGLLLLTRTDSPEAVRKQTVSLNEIITGVSRETGITFPPIPQLLVTGEESLLRSAIRNVLDNAACYAPGSPPEISFSEENGTIKMLIADRGPGIPVSEQERIFEPLVRLDAARTLDDKSGFGLGLAIARNTMRVFGGDITCSNRLDGLSGAAFTIIFQQSDNGNHHD